MTRAPNIIDTYLHVQDNGRTDAIEVTETFWGELASGALPHLDQGRLMSAFTFAESWSMWERHPAGAELVMLLSGAATIVLEEQGQERSIELNEVGAYALVPPNVWHTAKTSVPTRMLFLTSGAGTQHRPVLA